MNKVFRSLLFSAIVASSFTAFAQESLDLEPTMKAMGMQMKILGRALIGKEPTPKDQLDLAAKTLADLIAVAMTKAPHQMIGSDGAVREDAKIEHAQFGQALGMLLVEVKNLQAALASNDLDAAAVILKEKVAPVQRAGHEQFRKNDE